VCFAAVLQAGRQAGVSKLQKKEAAKCGWHDRSLGRIGTTAAEPHYGVRVDERQNWVTAQPHLFLETFCIIHWILPRSSRNNTHTKERHEHMLANPSMGGSR